MKKFSRKSTGSSLTATSANSSSSSNVMNGVGPMTSLTTTTTTLPSLSLTSSTQIQQQQSMHHHHHGGSNHRHTINGTTQPVHGLMTSPQQHEEDQASDLHLQLDTASSATMYHQHSMGVSVVKNSNTTPNSATTPRQHLSFAPPPPSNENVKLNPISRHSSSLSKKSLSTSFKRLLFGCRNVKDEQEEQAEEMLDRSRRYLADRDLFSNADPHATPVDDDDSYEIATSPVMAMLSPRGKHETSSKYMSSPSKSAFKRRSAESPTQLFLSNNNHTNVIHNGGGGGGSIRLLHETSAVGDSINGVGSGGNNENECVKSTNGTSTSTPLHKYYHVNGRSKIFAGALAEEQAEEILIGNDYPQKVHFHFEGQFEVKQCHHLDTISDILPGFKDCVTPFVKIEWSVEFFNTQSSGLNGTKNVPFVKSIASNPSLKQAKKTTVTCLEIGRKEVSWNEVLDFSIQVEGYLHKNMIEVYKQFNFINSNSDLDLSKPYGDHIIGILLVKSSLFDYDDLLMQENIISHHVLEFPITLKGLLRSSASSPQNNSVKAAVMSTFITPTTTTTTENNSSPPAGTFSPNGVNMPLDSTNNHSSQSLNSTTNCQTPPVKIQATGQQTQQLTKGSSPMVGSDLASRFSSDPNVIIFEKNQSLEVCQMSQDKQSEIVLSVLPVMELSYYVKMMGTTIVL
ncbi:hypothetical protein C9374_012280 [Naegleria lovaniensis]|uniref:Uncharacterized protein n=1 Tax=Naegleria lovaniensis TaxID=51637 RepID=A0AA88GFV6_NAELO|nr:uncharacterized protein C9374_012280 [Naegleria lovaniensis]KAG2373291.1 hypothetical protein C9374_012280 [Naegleria lovaniensis]